MNKVSIIIQREYLTRVRKKSFIIMTVIGPLLLAGIMIVPIWLAMQEKSAQKIEVIDETGLFEGIIPNTSNIIFDYPPISIEEAKRDLYLTDYTAILYIPKNLGPGGGRMINLFYKKQPGVNTEIYIKNIIEKMLFDANLLANKIDKDVLLHSKMSIKVTTEKQLESGQTEETNTETYVFIGFLCGILIYIFIFMYGVQVMKGVIEEKTNRIVEIIISSVKPFQLMLGKIIGVALVGLTQFILWTIITYSIYFTAQSVLFREVKQDLSKIEFQQEEVFKKGADLEAMKSKNTQSTNEVLDIFKGLKKINFIELILCFVFYFLGGYLLYSAMFAAIGSAVDAEADTQQFMLPVTIPLIFSFIIAQTVVQDPESNMAYWFSLIPFTSPIIMMVRLPFGVPLQELLLSMTLLVIGFIATTWLAARIYRTGILMYGKKVTYKELWRWLSYKG